LKPALLRNYAIRLETGEDGADDALVFTSETRRLVVRGRSFGTFVDRVVPLLDGEHTLEDIQDEVADVFAADDVAASVSLLRQNLVVEDAEEITLPSEAKERLAPQLNYLRQTSADPAATLDALRGATVTVVGLGAIGVVAATALAASGVGHVRCVDGATVSPADPYLSQLFDVDEVGLRRAEVVQEKIRSVSPATSTEAVVVELADDDRLPAAIEGSSFVLGCLDPGQSSITRALNRACLAQSTPWSGGTASALEGVVGPTVLPFETACYLCYEGRLVAAADDPAVTLAGLREQERRPEDLSRHRESLAFGAGVVGNLLALECFKALVGARPSTAGRIHTIDFATVTMRRHVVLRKPWCPACFPAAAS
jgi:bacteriocin biosynthesis cyclodehydratase domain-containing protein